jgi:hypothetical protein
MPRFSRQINAMKKRWWLTCVLICFLGRVQSQDVLSLGPVFTEQDAELIAAAEGIWELKDLQLILSFKRIGDNFYHLSYGGSGKEVRFEAVFTSVGNCQYLDLSPVLPQHTEDSFYLESFLSGHRILKISFSGDSLKMSEMNYKWFYEFVHNPAHVLKHTWTDRSLLLTGTCTELRNFLAQNGQEENIFNAPSLLVKKENTQGKEAFPGLLRLKECFPGQMS